MLTAETENEHNSGYSGLEKAQELLVQVALGLDASIDMSMCVLGSEAIMKV